MVSNNTGLLSVPSPQAERLEAGVLARGDTQQPKPDRNTDPKLPPVTRSDPTVAALAFILTAGFFGLLFILCFHNVPDANLAMMNIVLGSLGTAWIGAMAYFFGASRNN